MIPGVDYMESFSHDASDTAVRVTIAVTHIILFGRQMDK